ncbi:uncharacterized protein LOC127698976 [Mytilus californianus]|uniref:uncharacterized protein LOC127698976 n=1 Tax=Mytilus californianus TaxID=6549 RepID=UPI00224659F7|nr:uncharacterized protein LOC127698976 [Mytilus californianus]
MLSHNSLDIRSDSGFLEEDSNLEDHPANSPKIKKICTVDDIASLMRNTHLQQCDNDIRFSPCSPRSTCSLVSSASDAQSEERKSILKSVSSYKRKKWTESNHIDLNGNSHLCVESQNNNVKNKSHQPRAVYGKLQRCQSSPIKRTVNIKFPDEAQTSCSDSYQKKMKIISNLNSYYDSRLERSKSFLHGQSKVFAKASQYLTPAKPGLRKLQVCYSKTNMELNKGKIFGDLVKTAHKQNMVICDSVDSIERRLYRKRTDPTKKTTYFANMNKPDPFRVKSKKAQTVAEKEKERKDRILETTEEIRLGFKRTAKTVKLLTPDEVEKLKRCRYLRLDPAIQLQLEENDLC